MAKTNWQERQVSLSGAIVGCAVTLAIGVFIGCNWQTVERTFLPIFGVQASEEHDWSGLNEVYSALESNYNGELDFDTMLDGAKKGMTAALGDEYTAYMNAEEYSEYEKSLHGEVGAGIGVEIGLRDGYVRVIRTLPDNPARNAGVLAGDVFYIIEGESVYGWSTEDIANKLQGEAGTSVNFSVLRDGEEIAFTAEREEINNVSAYATYADGVATLTITRFDTDTGEIVNNLVDEFAANNVNRVIVDLRGNGGGYVSAAKDIASLWLDGDKIVTQRSLKTGDTVTYANRGQARLADMETVVLVDGTTASASEILAGALQDYDKATIIGEQTYGKGVVQTLVSLSAGTMLKVTTADWYTPNGTSINHLGITPNQVVENTYEDTNAGRDPQMQAAIEFLNN